jgi:hypothetical protein
MNDPGSSGDPAGIIMGLAFAFVGIGLITAEQYVIPAHGILYSAGVGFTGFGLFMTAAFTDH